MNPAIISNTKGASDLNAPTVLLQTSLTDPILSSSVLTYCTFSKGPIVGFTSSDVTLTNCTLSSFTQVSGNLWTFILNPVIDGTFTAKVNAASATWNNINNTASNTLTKTYVSGATYDLQNAAILSKSQHYRGHIASFSDDSDYLASTNVPGGEMLASKYNVPATMFANGTSQTHVDMFNFGRLDFGIITLPEGGAGQYSLVNPLVTTTRQGVEPSVNSYKNGDDSYKAVMMTRMLFSRNSLYEQINGQCTRLYSGYTDVQLSSIGSTFRWDYYADTIGGTPFYRGNQAAGDSKLATVVADIISVNGWYSNFTHWHWWKGDYPIHYYELLNSLLSGYDVYKGTVNTIAEYYWVKEAIDSVTATGNTITVHHTKKYPSSHYDKIHTPAWIKLDTTGTVLAGNDISANNGLRIRKISTNVFYVPVLLDFTQVTSIVSLGITTSPDYVNLTTPVVGRSGNTITSDQLVKLTLFNKLKTEPYEINVAVLERKFTFATSFTLSTTLDTVNRDYYLAFINQDGISGVLQF